MSSLSGIKCWGEPLPPQEFLRKYGLPQVVRVFEGNRVQGPARVDLDRPLLLYKAYVCQQVHARSIDRDKNGGITSVGPALILPDTYLGECLFLFLNMDKSLTLLSHKSRKCYRKTGFKYFTLHDICNILHKK